MSSNPEVPPPTESDSNVFDLPGVNTDDEMQSMESKFKEFEFQQIGLSNDTTKCMDFWKIMREQPINPAPPSLSIENFSPKLKHDHKQLLEEPIKECECYVWCKALYELQKRNMDQVALATISKPKLDKPCKYCANIKNLEQKPDTPDDLTILNKFKGLDITDRHIGLCKSTQTSFEDKTYIRGHPFVDKVTTMVSVYDPTVIISSDEDSF